MSTTTDVSLVMDVCGVSMERARELIDAAGGANSAERAIDLHLQQQTPTVPAPQPPSSSPSLPLQTKKKKSRTRAANPKVSRRFPRAGYQRVDSTNPPSASPSVADEVQPHSARFTGWGGGDSHPLISTSEALRDVRITEVPETVHVNGCILPTRPAFVNGHILPAFARICAQGTVHVPRECKVNREGDQTVIQIRPYCLSSCRRGKDFAGLVGFIFICSLVVAMMLLAKLDSQTPSDFFGFAFFGLIILFAGVVPVSLSSFCNSTYVTINHDGVTVKDRSQSKTTQFDKSGGYQEIQVRRTMKGSHKYPWIGYELDLENRDGPQSTVVFDHKELVMALFVQQEIEKYLTTETGASASASPAEIEMV